VPWWIVEWPTVYGLPSIYFRLQDKDILEEADDHKAPAHNFFLRLYKLI
jgi:hypothetical protein